METNTSSAYLDAVILAVRADPTRHTNLDKSERYVAETQFAPINNQE